MCFVYVVEHGSVLGIDGGNLSISSQNNDTEFIPKETIEGISFFSKSHMTSTCIQHCLENDVKVGFFTQTGNFYGMLTPTYHTSSARQKKQIFLSEDEEFSLEFAKKLIHAKINNQLVVLRRYASSAEQRELIQTHIQQLEHSRKYVKRATRMVQVLGYEGIAARRYFAALSLLISSEFGFSARTRRPAKDPFNCMLNFGYSILTKEIYGEIESRGLSAFFGFMHKDHGKHPALASDLIEEWRAPIVDATVLSMIQGHEVHAEDFVYDEDGRCTMSTAVFKKYLGKLESKMYTEMKYLDYLSTPVSFRKGIWHQAERVAKMIDEGNLDKYQPVIIR